MNFIAKLEKSKTFWVLLTICVVFFLLRLPSLFEPYWYGDEGIYQTIGTAMNDGRLLYKEIWDNKPPLLYVLYAFFNGDQFLLRFVSLFFGLISIIIFFFLGKRLSTDIPELHHTTGQKGLYIATGIFSLFLALPLLEGNIANTENFMLLFPLLAGLCIYRYLDTKNPKALWYAGVLLSIETLFKIVGIFDFAAFSLFLLLLHYKHPRYLTTQIKQLLPLGISYLLPLVLTMAYFYLNGAFSDFISGAITQMVGYVGYGNMFFVPQGLLYVKILLLICGIFFLFKNKSSLSTSSLFIYLWLLFSLFSTFFSQRPYPHYLLILLPSFCLFMLLLITNFSIKKARVKSTLSERNIHIAIFFGILLLVYGNFRLYKNVIPYYQNFVSFLAGTKSVEQYQRFFDTNVPRDYAIAQFLRMHTKPQQVVFLWGNSAQVYKMSQTLPPGRYTVEYHITGAPKGHEETAKAIEKTKPRFIVVMSSTTIPFDLSHYRYVFSIYESPVYEYNL